MKIFKTNLEKNLGKHIKEAQMFKLKGLLMAKKQLHEVKKYPT